MAPEPQSGEGVSEDFQTPHVAAEPGPKPGPASDLGATYVHSLAYLTLPSLASPREPDALNLTPVGGLARLRNSLKRVVQIIRNQRLP